MNVVGEDSSNCILYRYLVVSQDALSGLGLIPRCRHKSSRAVSISSYIVWCLEGKSVRRQVKKIRTYVLFWCLISKNPDILHNNYQYMLCVQNVQSRHEMTNKYITMLNIHSYLAVINFSYINCQKVSITLKVVLFSTDGHTLSFCNHAAYPILFISKM